MVADPHLGFILAAYAIAGAVIAGLIGWITLDHRRQTALIADLEKRGITRRSRAFSNETASKQEDWANSRSGRIENSTGRPS